jgi:uncharacterized membrane protein YdbT with pleckstrin-like domain
MSKPMAMRYVERVLQPQETIVHASRLHWQIYRQAALLFIVCAGLAFVATTLTTTQPSLRLALGIAAGLVLLLALSAGLRAFARRATTELAITDLRIIYKSGLVRRHTLEMNRSKVESVDVDQTILGRVLDYGTIIVRGTGGSLEPIRDIAEPLAFRTRITVGP